MEKIHGTSAHISWSVSNKQVKFSSGGESHEKFIKLFDVSLLTEKFSDIFVTSDAIIYGEAYGGKQQGMSDTYGKELKFIGFEVKVGDLWLSIPNAEGVCKSLNIDFVDYIKCSTNLDVLNSERDKDSVQAIRNGCGEGKIREGIVLKPLIELTTNNGGRVIAKHKRDEFKETKTPREVSPEQFEIMTNAKAIADEWVTEMRLKHVLDKLPQGINVESTKLVIDAMVDDVYREAKGEIIESREVTKFIGSNAAKMFQAHIKKQLSQL